MWPNERQCHERHTNGKRCISGVLEMKLCEYCGFDLGKVHDLGLSPDAIKLLHDEWKRQYEETCERLHALERQKLLKQKGIYDGRHTQRN
jgi:hypothetical protein